MAKKTVLKLLLSKWGILSVDMQKAMVSDQGIVKADETVEFADNATAVEGEIVEEVA